MGVNLLPFIDRERLQRAMTVVDDGEKNLTKAEQERNKRTGQVMVYFNGDHAGDSVSMKENRLSGKIDIKLDDSKFNFRIGDSISKCYGSLELEFDKCQAFIGAYQLAPCNGHSSQLLKGVQPPEREVEDFAIYHVNRRHFQGEAAIRIVEEVLKIDTSQDPIYNLRGRQQGFRGPGGSRMNAPDHGLTEGNFQALPQIGQRRSYRDFDRNRDDGGDHANKRFRPEGYGA